MKSIKKPSIPSVDELLALNKKSNSEKPKEANKSNNANLKVNNTTLAKAYLNAHYDFRYNLIIDETEWKLKADSDFIPLNDYKLNSLTFELESKGSSISNEKLARLLKSDFIPLINPINQYFELLESIQVVDGSIQKLAQTLKVENQDLFEKHLTKWLVGTVANSLTREGCQNHTCLVLTGEQGTFKTTWLTNLCPPILKQYIFTGRINVDNVDTTGMLAEYFIINIDDQLRNLNRKDENALKTLITLDSIKIRKPYDRLFTKRPRIASFCGSVNGNDFLTDPSGSRRFLPFEALEINLEATYSIDMNTVWAEAYRLFKSGFQYWFTKEEISELKSNNENFEVSEPEYELLMEYFERIERNHPEEEHLTTAIIQHALEKNFDVKLNAKKLGEALSKLGFIRYSKKINGKPRYGYAVKRIK
jgi:predicted P-loop ATPase